MPFHSHLNQHSTTTRANFARYPILLTTLTISQQGENKFLELTPKPAAPAPQQDENKPPELTPKPAPPDSEWPLEPGWQLARPDRHLRLWVPVDKPTVYFWPYPWMSKHSPDKDRARLEKMDKRSEWQQLKLDVLHSVRKFEAKILEFARRNGKVGYKIVDRTDRLARKPMPRPTRLA